MGTLDEFRRAYGNDLGRPSEIDYDRGKNWLELCVCGHVSRYHPTTAGGRWNVPPVAKRVIRETEVTVIQVSQGCCGAMPPRNFEGEVTDVNFDTNVMTITHVATCPCRELRPIANVDRPNRYFNQRINPERHPFAVGVRAFTTHLTRLKSVRQAKDPEAMSETVFDRRFVWIEGQRRCSISSCKAQGEGVLPCFVNDELHSEMRCEKHR